MGTAPAARIIPGIWRYKATLNSLVLRMQSEIRLKMQRLVVYLHQFIQIQLTPFHS